MAGVVHDCNEPPELDMRAATSSSRFIIREMYDAMYAAYGPQHWWPGDSPTEIVVGAILTQNTNWRNVERAIGNLKDRNLLSFAALREVELEALASAIRPAGYYNVKARRLKNFAEWLWQAHEGGLHGLRGMPLEAVRRELLGINGIGPETADSILLYALEMPSFVVDAYTKRIAIRHQLASADVSYEQLRGMFQGNMPSDHQLFNEYHALLVAIGKNHCRTKAQCEGCPLAGFPHLVESSCPA